MKGVKYSRYDLINKELLALEERGFLNRAIYFLMKDRRLSFEISVSNDHYQRAEILCDDIVQKRREDKVYTQSELVEHVFLDFIDEVRNNDSNVEAIYTRLNVRKQQLPIVNNNPLIPTKSNTTVMTRINRDVVLRAEVLLQDLSYFVPKHGLDVEQLIEIVYLDFLLEYTKGRRKNVIKDILEYLEG